MVVASLSTPVVASSCAPTAARCACQRSARSARAMVDDVTRASGAPVRRDVGGGVAGTRCGPGLRGPVSNVRRGSSFRSTVGRPSWPLARPPSCTRHGIGATAATRGCDATLRRLDLGAVAHHAHGVQADACAVAQLPATPLAVTARRSHRCADVLRCAVGRLLRGHSGLARSSVSKRSRMGSGMLR